MIGKLLINKYKIISALGEGGMSNVYLAEHVMLKRKYAVKMLADHLLRTPGFKDRFFKEGLAQAQLQHDNIVQVIDYIEEDGKTFLLMDYIEGECLDQLINRKGKLSESECIQIMSDILEALNFAHENGVIHRDIKPSNIIISNSGKAKLMDFGIAIMMGDKRMTATGTNIGTSWYMSPEHVTRPKEIDHRSDVYSIGIVLYEMLTGDVPFDGETDYEIKDSHVRKPVTPPVDINQSISLEMNNIVLKALSKNPDERFDGCMDFFNYLNILDDEDETIEEPEINKKSDNTEIIQEIKKTTLEEIPSLKTTALINEKEESYAQKELEEVDTYQSTKQTDNKHDCIISKHMHRCNRNVLFTNMCIIYFVLVIFYLCFRINSEYYFQAIDYILIFKEYTFQSVLGIFIMIICSYNILKVIRRISNPGLHPIYISINEKFGGSVEEIVSDINNEIINCSTIGSTIITNSWVLHPFMFRLDIFNIHSEVVWIYHHHEIQHFNYIPFKTNYVKIYTRHKDFYLISSNFEKAENIIQEISYRAPWLFAGYKPEIENLWASNPTKLIETVDEYKSNITSKQQEVESYSKNNRDEHETYHNASQEKHKPKFKTVSNIIFIIVGFIMAISFIYGIYDVYQAITKPTKIDLTEIEKSIKKANSKEYDKSFTNSLGMKFMLIPAGSFMMGSPEDEPGRDGDEKLHRVFLTNTFYMQNTEVTQGQWKAVMGNNPSIDDRCGDSCPVECVSWNDVQEFIKKLNIMDKDRDYRLPTEAEWEYAARAGTTTAFAFGNRLDRDDANFECQCELKFKYNINPYTDPLGSVTICPLHKKEILPVGSLKKNNWGLFDMHGNVREWCQDWYRSYPSITVVNPVEDRLSFFIPDGYRVIRGGGYDKPPSSCRSAERDQVPPYMSAGYGFRLVTSPKP